MSAVLFGILGFVVGFVVGAVAVLIVYLIATTVFGFHDFEGATAMGLVTIAPLAGLLGGGIGAALFVMWFGR
jgi:hypothetical protein